MNNEKILKKKIQQYLLMPLALTVLLVGMVIVLYVHDKKSGAIAAAAVFIFVVCEIIFFIVMKAAIMPTTVPMKPSIGERAMNRPIQLRPDSIWPVCTEP